MHQFSKKLIENFVILIAILADKRSLTNFEALHRVELRTQETLGTVVEVFGLLRV